MQTLPDMAVFVEVVDRQSFTGAAEALDISKAAASRHVSRLEQRLGVRLMNRTTRRLTLTEAGNALYARLKPALADVAAAEAEILDLGEAPRGRLRVTAPAFFAQPFFMRPVAGFLRRYAELELEIEYENRIVDLVADRIDVAIRITTLTSSSLVARRLAAVRIVTVASPQYLARHGRPEKPIDLRAHNVLGYTPAPAPDELRFRDAQGGSVGVRIRGNFHCNNDDAIKCAALEHMGIATFPDIFVGEELASGALVRVLDAFELPAASLCAVFPTRRNLAPKVRVFVDFLAETFAPQPARP